MCAERTYQSLRHPNITDVTPVTFARPWSHAEEGLLAAPRGYCAGVDRAVEAVEQALAKHGPPVYVRKQIVHNLHVVRDLESKGAVFVDEETEVPEGAVVVLSAHGVAPDVYANAQTRGLTVLDATCPLVTKVHLEAAGSPPRGARSCSSGTPATRRWSAPPGRLHGARSWSRTSRRHARSRSRTRRTSRTSRRRRLVDETNEIIGVLRERFPTSPAHLGRTSATRRRTGGTP